MRDLTGLTYGRLTVIDHSHYTGEHHYWNCLCECGNMKKIQAGALIQNRTKSCGCITKDMMTKHGYEKDPLYYIYIGMKGRCYNEKKKAYVDYGGRGISICTDWLNDIGSFIKWGRENGYEKGLSIERIDVNGNYEPGNCKWIPISMQGWNTRKTIYIEHKGKAKPLPVLASEYGIKQHVLNKRLFVLGWDIERALSTPVKAISRKFIEYNGITKSLCEYADEFNISRDILYNRIFNRGWSVERALTQPLRERK
jgi:hypothetical protein